MRTETDQGFDCGMIPTTQTSKPVVSLCEGCSTDDANNPCIEVGAQKQETDGTTVYCSSGKKLEMVKEAGENCNNDYECLGYICENQICTELKEKETPPIEVVPPVGPSTQGGVNLILPIVFLVVIGAIFILDAIFSFSKKASKKLKKPKKHCQECGATLAPEDDFCPECGEKV